MKHVLADAINRMPDRERLVLTLYYYEGLTLAEIGEVLGVTESRVLPDPHEGDPAAALASRRAGVRTPAADPAACTAPGARPTAALGSRAHFPLGFPLPRSL